MAAAFLSSRATGMENSRAFVRSQAGHLQLFEGADGRRWYRRPRGDFLRRGSAPFAEAAVDGVIVELKFKQFQGEIIESCCERCLSDVRRRFTGVSNELAQARDEISKGCFGSHAVLFVMH